MQNLLGDSYESKLNLFLSINDNERNAFYNGGEITGYIIPTQI